MSEIKRGIHTLIATPLEGSHVPLLIVPSAESLGIPPRRDTKLSPNESLKQIYAEEGLRMGSNESIRISDDGLVSFEVFTTIAASPHTVFAIPYNVFEEKWERINPSVKTSGEKPYVAGTENGHSAYVPLQLTTWVMIKRRNPDNMEEYEMSPIDVYQLAEQRPEIKVDGETDSLTIPDEAIKRMYASLGSHIETNTVLLQDIFNTEIREKINKQLMELGIQMDEKAIWGIANTMGVGYYRGNTEIDGKGGGPQSNQTFHVHTTTYPNFSELRKRIAEKVIQPRKALNDFATIEKMSIFDPHIIYQLAAYLKSYPKKTILEAINQIAPSDFENEVRVITDMLEQHFGWNGERSSDEEAVRNALIAEANLVMQTAEKFNTVFNQSSSVLGEVQFYDPKSFSPERVFKQVDPFSTYFYKAFDGWAQKKLRQAFSQQSVSSFIHHTEPHRFDMRMAEGWTVDLPNTTFTQVNLGMNSFLDDMERLWRDVETAWKQWYINRDDKVLIDQLTPYGLSADSITLLKSVIPTNKQLDKWIIEEPMSEETRKRLQYKLERRRGEDYRERAGNRIENSKSLELGTYYFGLYQVLDGSYQTPNSEVKFNKGYNIPGKPSFGITYVRTENGWQLHVSPLLSLKGLAEQYVGVPLERQTKI